MNRKQIILGYGLLSLPFVLLIAFLVWYGTKKPYKYPTYQYTITYTVYYPTESKKITETGTIEAPNDVWRPRAEKIVRRKGVKIKVWPHVIYEGKSDVEINSFTYKKN